MSISTDDGGIGPGWSVPLDPPAFPPARYERLGRRLAAVLDAAHHDVLIVPGEAVVALEAVAREAGASGAHFLNVATSVYGRLFGEWLASAGATVTTLEPSVAGRPITLEEVSDALTASGAAVLAFVHGEAATGILNPLAGILALARACGAVTIVDAVASVGAEPLHVADGGPDIVVIGPQKALGGPAGVSAVAIDEAGWGLLRRRPDAPAFSSLSLLDIRRDWLDTSRRVVPGTPHLHDLWALEAALDALEHETLPVRIARHRLASAAARAGIDGLGMTVWSDSDQTASGLTTAFLLPSGLDRGQIVHVARECFGVTLAEGPAGVDPRMLRISHIGRLAGFAPVLSSVIAAGASVRAAGGQIDLGAGTAAVAQAYASEGGTH